MIVRRVIWGARPAGLDVRGLEPIWSFYPFSSFSFSLSFSCTIDKASNSRLSAELLGLVYIPCFAHTLNLCVQAAVQSVAPLVSFLDSLRDFTKLMNKSYKATSLLRLCIEQSSDRVKTTITTYKPQRNLSKELPKRLIKPVPQGGETGAPDAIMMLCYPRNKHRIQFLEPAMASFSEKCTAVTKTVTW